jgi:uncharacterized LabA/DUF88 family protein/cold shock CspA family protein
MLKGGIFLDMENLMRNGGWGIRYDVVREFAEAQGVTVLRANAYMALDTSREGGDPVLRQKKEGYRAAIRRNGFHLTLKPVMRYRNEDGEEVTKANADLDLAVDALLQTENLDYVLLGTGDGDFVRLVRALQSRGKRVDVLSFANTSSLLKDEADNYVSGFLVPELVPDLDEGRHRGLMHYVDEPKGFGFITARTGLKPTDVRDDIFCHIREFTRHGAQVSNQEFAALRTNGAIVEFAIEEQPDGKVRARGVKEVAWDDDFVRV